jgi:hypothetical protein
MKRVSAEKNSGCHALDGISTPNGNNEPATKADLAALERRLEARMDQMKDELIEKMRDMQTEVLRAFHSWARPIEIRMRSVDDIQERLGLLEERVSAIERERR